MCEALNKYPVPIHDFNLYNRGRVEIIKQSMRDMPTIYNAIK